MPPPSCRPGVSARSSCVTTPSPAGRSRRPPSAWDAALAADRPVVLEAITDPEVPPLPPHITFAQAEAMASALAHGDPSRGQIIKQAAKGKLEEFLPGR